MTSSTRVSRCGAATLASLAALSLAACGSSGTSSTASSNSSKPATSSSPSATSSGQAPAAAGRDRTSGIVGAVSGATITLTGPNGPVTVDVTPTTRVMQLTAAQLTDVTAGDCLVARPTKDSAGSPSVTAAAVLFGAADHGQCVPPGTHGGRATMGTVASVGGNTITLTTANNEQATVTVTPDTRYAKRSTADPSVIAPGQCLMAQGAKANDGSLQATSVNVRPSNSGPCAGRHQGG
ncbi:MAG: hypothetical protein QOH82_4603 [Mycobacterium sp.]|nr:hypothetical protein [Mycobacterium sp.]